MNFVVVATQSDVRLCQLRFGKYYGGLPLRPMFCMAPPRISLLYPPMATVTRTNRQYGFVQ